MKRWFVIATDPKRGTHNTSQGLHQAAPEPLSRQWAGHCGQEPLLRFSQGGVGKAGSAGSGLAGENNSSRFSLSSALPWGDWCRERVTLSVGAGEGRQSRVWDLDWRWPRGGGLLPEVLGAQRGRQEAPRKVIQAHLWVFWNTSVRAGAKASS